MVAARDDKGRFIKGQSGNPSGRSPREIEKEYLDATIQGVSLRDWQDIVSKAVEDAKAGDKDARKWLSEYLIGKPKERLDVTSGDQQIINVTWGYVPARGESEN